MKHILVLALLMVLASCKNVEKSKEVPIDNTSQKKVALTEKNHPGKKMLEAECYICHNPKASEESMIAPPFIAIKKHYIEAHTTKEEFTEALVLWITDPEAPSKMPGAQKKFGSMPYIPYPEDAIAQIAAYIYDYEIEKPVWFDAHYQERHGKGKGKGKGMGKYQGKSSENHRSNLTDAGLEYAQTAKTTLGKNLMRAIQEKGTTGAIEFCKTEAIKLTDSISLMKNAIIKRVSDKPRNPENAANEEELGYIKYYKKLIAAGTEPKPITKTEKGEVNFYYPITTNAMCLQCHGKPKAQIQPETLTTLKNLYPTDKAVGYDSNEVRGIWAINFEEGSIE
jgi:nitrate reductase cytochrome c-type subunit